MASIDCGRQSKNIKSLRVVFGRKEKESKMSNSLVVFESTEMTIHDANGNRWLSGMDVAKALGYNSARAFRELVRDLKKQKRSKGRVSLFVAPFADGRRTSKNPHLLL